MRALVLLSFSPTKRGWLGGCWRADLSGTCVLHPDDGQTDTQMRRPYHGRRRWMHEAIYGSRCKKAACFCCCVVSVVKIVVAAPAVVVFCGQICVFR